MADKRIGSIVVGRINKSRRWTAKKMLILFLMILFLVAAILFGRYLIQSRADKSTEVRVSEQFGLMNEQIEEGNDVEALEHARKALALNPDDIDAILTVAYAAENAGASDTEELYARALEIFKQKDNPDVDNKEPATYWAAGGLAEGAGLTDQAKQYFQKTLDVVDYSDPNMQEIIMKSQEALERLQ